MSSPERLPSSWLNSSKCRLAPLLQPVEARHEQGALLHAFEGARSPGRQCRRQAARRGTPSWSGIRSRRCRAAFRKAAWQCRSSSRSRARAGTCGHPSPRAAWAGCPKARRGCVARRSRSGRPASMAGSAAGAGSITETAPAQSWPKANSSAKRLPGSTFRARACALRNQPSATRLSKKDGGPARRCAVPPGAAG